MKGKSPLHVQRTLDGRVRARNTKKVTGASRPRRGWPSPPPSLIASDIVGRWSKLMKVVDPTGIEPATSPFVRGNTLPLSYGSGGGVVRATVWTRYHSAVRRMTRCRPQYILSSSVRHHSPHARRRLPARYCKRTDDRNRTCDLCAPSATLYH